MAADPAEARLLDAIRPPRWINPEPPRRYDLVVIGGGTAGLVSAMGAAGLGARVALVERARLGGDCLNTGCVPSKALLRSARAAADARRASALGVRTAGVDVDFAAVMQRMRERRADIAPHDSAERLRAAGVDVYFGEARLAGRSELLVAERRLRFRRAVIATGARASVPPIPGLAALRYLTNETAFELEQLPRRLAVLGAGPVGCELAQAFARLGSQVTLLDEATRILPSEDADAAAIVARRISGEGVALRLGVKIRQVSSADGEIRLHLDTGGGDDVPACDHVLVAVGRTPNLDGLDLDAAGVAATANGIVVDDRLRTSNRRIFAAGDVCSAFKFTHAADALARIVIRNALFFGRARASALVIPWCTYTDPEIAHVGSYEDEARRAGRRVETITIALAEVDRAVVDEESDGFVRVHHEGGRLLGCTAVAAHAGEMIGVATHALTHGASLADLGSTIYPYPTLNNAFRAAGDAYGRRRLTGPVRRLLHGYFGLFR